MEHVDVKLINAAHRAQDFTNKTGQVAYVYYCRTALRYEALKDYPLPGRLESEYYLVAITEVEDDSERVD